MNVGPTNSNNFFCQKVFYFFGHVNFVIETYQIIEKNCIQHALTTKKQTYFTRLENVH
jgi:hypothetical protein